MPKPLLRPSAYAEILAGSERPLVVGGQAINIWAEVYANQAHALANLDRPQDLKHTRMLLQIIPHYFNELNSELRTSRLTEDTLLAAIRYAGSVILAPFALNAARSHKLDLRSIFPSSLRMGGPETIRGVIQGICERMTAS